MIDCGVEVIESAASVVGQDGIVRDWFENGCGERSVDTVEELQEQDAEAKALAQSDGTFGSWAL